MANLKSGTLIGGNLIWNAGNMPLTFSSDKLYITDKQIYTTGFKPTAADVGAYTKAEVDTLGKLCVLDVRGEDRKPNYFTDKRLTPWFNSTAMPTNDWYSGITVKGWTNDYNSWQLFSSSYTGASDNKLYFRTGKGTAWNATYEVYHSGRKPSSSDVGAVSKSGDTMTGLLTITRGNENLILKAADGQANYLSGYRGDTRQWYIGNADASTNTIINNAAHGTNVTLTDSKIVANKELYVNANRVYHTGFKPNELAGSNYTSPGQQTPDWFGRGKLRYQMIRDSGTWDNAWSDGLWISSYTGDDVKRSNLLVMSKVGAPRIGFRQQNYDSDTWGTLNEIYHTSNKPTAADVGAVNKTGDRMSGLLYNTNDYAMSFIAERNDTNASFGCSSTKGEFIFGGRQSTTGDYTQYIRMGVNKLKWHNAGTEYDIYHKGNKPDLGDLVDYAHTTFKTVNINAPSGVEGGKWYPVVISNMTTGTEDVYIQTKSSGGSDPMNCCSFSGKIRAAGWSDKTSSAEGMFTIYDSNERAIHSVVSGTESEGMAAFYVEGRAFPIVVRTRSICNVSCTGKDMSHGTTVFKAGVVLGADPTENDYGTKINKLLNFNRGSLNYNTRSYISNNSFISKMSGNAIETIGGFIRSNDDRIMSLDGKTYSFVTSLNDAHLCQNAYWDGQWKKYNNADPSGVVAIINGELKFKKSDGGYHDPNQRQYNVYHEGKKPTAGDVGAVASNSRTVFNAPFVMRTSNYFDDTSLRNLDFAGFYRANGAELDGKSLPGLMVHCPHSSGKAHARGIGFSYGTSWDVTTYRFDNNGVYQGQSKIYHEQNKPTASELGVVPASDVNTTSSWSSVINKIPRITSAGVMEVGKYIDFHDTNSTRDFDVRLNSGANELVVATNNGTIDIGAKNSSFGHIYTDRSRFAFNKCLNVFSGYGVAIESDADPRIELHKPGKVAYAIAAASNNSFELWQSNGAGGWVKTLLRIDSNGYFWNAGNGDFNDVYIRSDERLKRNVKEVGSSLDAILNLKAVSYEKRKDLESEYDSTETGFIAQEVEKYLPDAVGENSDGLKHLKPYALIAHLTNAIQEQQKQINKLTKQVNKLRKGRK